MVITSLDNKKIKDLKKLQDRKYRDRENLFLIEGSHLVTEAYKSGALVEIIAQENTTIDIDAPITYVTKDVISELSSLITPSTIIGVCKKRTAKDNFGDHIVILDNVQDPGNLGTIIRSAVAFNVDTIVLGTGTVDIYNPKVLRATQGLIFHINIIEEDIEKIIPTLKKKEYKIIGTNVVNGTSLKTYDTPLKYALIMGNEGHGMDKSLEKRCDDFIYIDMNNDCESLNVGVACSIILYQLDKR